MKDLKFYKTLVMSAVMGMSVLSLSGCGFALRGTQNGLQVAPEYQSVEIKVADNPTGVTLKRVLAERLSMMGVKSTSSNNQISVDNLSLRRYELVGILTEVRLVLSADVSLTINGKTKTTQMQVEQSYQFNEASVSTNDGEQSARAQAWLQQNLADRIANFYRASTLNPSS